jgi:hypothetical protein
MNYNMKETDVAILDIGLGNADPTKSPLYEDLQKFGWIIISRLNGVIDKVELTFAGRELFNRLQNLQHSRLTRIY